MDIDLKDKVAVVTGASTGIGQAIALQLAGCGARVVVSYGGNRQGAEETAARIRDAGSTCIVHQADISKLPEAVGNVEAAVEEWGRIDILVNNAGITDWGAFLDYTEEQWDRVVDTNLKGTYFGSQAAARHMVKQGGGDIIIISSVVGRRAVSTLSAYATTKAGLEMMARSLMFELAPHNIRVNAVGVGPTIVDRNLRDDPHYAEHWAKVVPAGRAATADDIAGSILLLLSPLASYVHGHTLMVDGGWTGYSPTAEGTP
jgi:NAD(P)-dependent dehydrogenase (short-subunit alcohol dehydrogenase family)